jgi:hypothetical protein
MWGILRRDEVLANDRMNMRKRKGAGSTDNSRAKITEALLTAAEDLGTEVTAPYIIEAAEGRFIFVALVHDFGSPCGTLVGLPDDWETLGDVAEERLPSARRILLANTVSAA